MSDPQATPPMLEVQGLSVQFGGLHAVDNVDFVVSKSEILGLVGPNGAGKTTIFNTVSGMLKPSAGTILLRGDDITGLASERINALGVARTFQNVRPFAELSVRENIMMGAYGAGFCGVFASALRLPRHRQLERTARERADQWIERLGLSTYVDLLTTALPFGLQRVAEVARAMASAPDLLLLDEPAAGLDSHESVDLGNRLRRVVNSGLPILLVDHDMGLVLGICDYIYVLDFGKIIAQGTPEEIRHNPQVLAAYLGGTTTEAVRIDEEAAESATENAAR
jgi:ABC-type branched-subunit amino acid transport system ATPase component